ncbi:hypothetical protein GJ496_004580 [Pomphorhynchus laevis]|nr:hypothetical protein GJ496_004580 [Pomphorhynchus laevis]
MAPMLKALMATILISVIPYFCLLLIPPMDKNHNIMRMMLSFSAGALLGDSFLHLIPHVLSELEFVPLEEAARRCGQLVLTGIMIFFVIDKIIRANTHHHGSGEWQCKVTNSKRNDNNHNPEYSDGEDCELRKRIHKKDTAINESDKEHTESISPSGFLSLVADFTHNFTDGIAIGVSFAAGERIGWITSLSILLHEVPHELGDYALLIKSGIPAKKAARLQLLTALGAIIGCLLTYFASQIGLTNIIVMSITAGGFIYVATVSIIPDLIESSTEYESSLKLGISMISGSFCMVAVSYFE